MVIHICFVLHGRIGEHSAPFMGCIRTIHLLHTEYATELKSYLKTNSGDI